MFIERVKNPDISDRWYFREESISQPGVGIGFSEYIHPYKTLLNHFKNNVTYPSRGGHTEFKSYLIEQYNPVYSEGEGQFTKGISSILALKYFGLKNEIHNLLIELDI